MADSSIRTMLIFTTKTKSTGAGNSVSINVDFIENSGYFLVLGDGNGNTIFAIIAFHSKALTEIKSLGTQSVNASLSGTVLTIQTSNWNNIQVVSNVKVS